MKHLKIKTLCLCLTILALMALYGAVYTQDNTEEECADAIIQNVALLRTQASLFPQRRATPRLSSRSFLGRSHCRAHRDHSCKTEVEIKPGVFSFLF